MTWQLPLGCRRGLVKRALIAFFQFCPVRHIDTVAVTKSALSGLCLLDVKEPGGGQSLDAMGSLTEVANKLNADHPLLVYSLL